MKKSRLLGAVCATELMTALAFSTLTHAAPISYDESIDGDITSAPTFNLDVGINIISGSRTANKTSGVTVSDGDDFQFTLGPNMSLTNIEFSYTNVVVTGANEFRDTRFLDANPDHITIFNNAGPTDPSPKSLFSTLLPLGNGSYILTDGSFVSPVSIDGDWSASWDYTLSFTVVPVPAAVWLFGSGLLGLIGIARKKSV